MPLTILADSHTLLDQNLSVGIFCFYSYSDELSYQFIIFVNDHQFVCDCSKFMFLHEMKIVE